MGFIDLEIAFYKRQQLRLKKENRQLKEEIRQLILTLNESHTSHGNFKPESNIPPRHSVVSTPRRELTNLIK